MLAATLPQDAGLWAIVVLSFGTGLVHALDADHVAAVSALATRGTTWQRVMRVSGAWAIGHGATLLTVGAAVYLLGTAIPEDLAALAERSVGVILVVIGASVLRQLVHQRAHLHVHAHDELPSHAHLHTHDSGTAHDGSPHRHEHQAVLVGSAHGLAGSAPLLALLPLADVGSPVRGMTYLAVFAVGVFMAMALFGGLFGGLLRLGERAGVRLLHGVQAATGAMSVAFGAWLLFAA